MLLMGGACSPSLLFRHQVHGWEIRPVYWSIKVRIWASLYKRSRRCAGSGRLGLSARARVLSHRNPVFFFVPFGSVSIPMFCSFLFHAPLSRCLNGLSRIHTKHSDKRLIWCVRLMQGACRAAADRVNPSTGRLLPDRRQTKHTSGQNHQLLRTGLVTRQKTFFRTRFHSVLPSLAPSKRCCLLGSLRVSSVPAEIPTPFHRVSCWADCVKKAQITTSGISFFKHRGTYTRRDRSGCM